MVMVPSLRRSRIWIETHGEECLSIVGFIVFSVVIVMTWIIVIDLDCSNCSNCNVWYCMPSSYL